MVDPTSVDNELPDDWRLVELSDVPAMVEISPSRDAYRYKDLDATGFAVGPWQEWKR